MLTRLMKSVIAMVAAGLFLAGSAQAFDEGIDYKTLAQPQPTETGEKIEVLEFFWYGCPHCYQIEPTVERWLASKPDYVEFRRMPAILGGSWALHGRAYFAAELLGVLDQVHEPLFAALHKEKRRLGSEESLADWFAEQGVNRDEFLKAFRSFVVDMKVRRASKLGQDVNLDGVPAFVVNGKYLTSPSITASSEKMVQVINYLTAKEAGIEAKLAEE